MNTWYALDVPQLIRQNGEVFEEGFHMPFDGSDPKPITIALRATHALLQNPRHWAKFKEVICDYDEHKVSYCLVGAIRHVCADDSEQMNKISDILVRYLPSHYSNRQQAKSPFSPEHIRLVRLSIFNDRADHSGVMRLLERAIKDEA